MARRSVGTWAIVGMLALAGCGRMPGLRATPAEIARAQGAPGAEQPFPQGFMWGVATAGYQSEGHDTTSNWVAWAQAGKVTEPLGDAIDSYHRFGEDMDLAKGMGLNAYRMSLEWSRIEPARGQFDPAEVAHYHQVLDAAIARGLTPVVTVNHFTYPAWLDHPLEGGPGGWESPETLVEFRHFAQWAAHEYGSQVKWWITLNEPNTFALTGYLLGAWAPGKTNPLTYRAVLDRLVLAHREAYAAIHAEDPDAKVSFNPFVFRMRGASAQGQVKAEGFSPDEVALFDATMGKGTASASATLDYVAFDWYYPLDLTDVTKLKNAWEWPVQPEGLYATCKDLYARYKLPLMIAENGMATDGDRPRADGWTRSAFLVNHLAQLRRAMAEGVPVLGYMHWSIADNYEWGSYRPHFGLYAVDRRDVRRTRLETDAVGTYRAIASTNGLTPDLLERYLGKRN